jgi:adenosylcobinamide kinase / adenosylcobinamide-phosphate guanylyltransferase
MPFTLLLGGARSGKSDLAVRMAATSGRPVVVVATAEPRDDEMAERIRRHREARPASWTTLEVPVRLDDELTGVDPEAFVLLDCLSLWVSNAIEAGATADGIELDARAVAGRLAGREAPAAVVTNEVGLGIVPVNELARRYRDELGRVNAVFARAAARAYLIVAGRALALEEPTLA